MPRGKTSVHLRLDSDIVEWFKANGKGHLTRMNAVLRAYVDAHKKLHRQSRRLSHIAGMREERFNGALEASGSSTAHPPTASFTG